MSVLEGPEPIAIIGLAARVPGAGNVEELWKNILGAKESVTWFTDEELRASGVRDVLWRRTDYVKAGAVIPDIEMFDAEFFGITPAEAAMLDPQHRLFMECAWEALENAGHDPYRSAPSIGIYGGCFMNKYLPLNLYTNERFLQSSSAYAARNYNDKDFLAGRVAYVMNLRGPAVTVQTACSTSLVATHLATQALLSYECDIALVGGVAINLPQTAGYLAVEGTIFSASGQCRPFDSRSQGTVFGNGAGFVVLRRLSDAIAEGDHIRAVIRGTAVNNDGNNKVSFTAPNARAQTEVVTSAQAVAGISPRSVGYIEAHGTGTALGDPLEVAALTEAFRATTAENGFCALGSVKANVGHLDAAAGVIGLIRATLALERETIPPQANFVVPNPELQLHQTPFYIPSQPIVWPRGVQPRRAGVSSFGVGGTNAHVVLEEAPGIADSPTRSKRPHDYLLVASARTEPALTDMCVRLAEAFEGIDESDLARVAATLATGRAEFGVRASVVCSDLSEAGKALRQLDTGSFDRAQNSEVVFMFPGVGTQYPDMALEIYDSQAVFKEQVDFCALLLDGKLDMDIRRFLFPSRFDGPPIDPESVPHVLAAIFTIEYALALLWMSVGVQPTAMIGHSLGEYVAACLSGVLSLEDALDLTIRRGRIFDQIPNGRMMGVPMAASEVAPLLKGRLSIGAINAPGLCMVSGLQDDLDLLHANLTARGIECRPLPIRMASHSSLVEPFLEGFEAIVQRYRLSAPRIPYTSCLTGEWIRDDEATDPGYWARQLRSTVQFASMASTAQRAGRVMLEVGPGTTLLSLVRAQPFGGACTAVASMRHPDMPLGDTRSLLRAAGRLWQAGIKLDVARLQNVEGQRRLPLPTYPFQRKFHWVEPGYAVGPGLNGAQNRTLHDVSTAAGSDAECAPHMRVVAITVEEPPTTTEQRILAVWKEVLGLHHIGLDEDFSAIGGHSMVAAQVMVQLRAAFNCPLSVVDLFSTPTVRGLAELVRTRVEGASTTSAVPDLAKEVALDPSIQTDGLGPMHTGRYQSVFLTGATGFLGSFLLRELLKQTTARVYCLIRCHDATQGKERLRVQLKSLGIDDVLNERVSILPGDLEDARFGLSSEEFDTLAHDIDAIYHCGAWVNFARPYSVLKKANVGGTEEVLRLAATLRLKQVHHISTIFVTMGAMAERIPTIGEDDPLPPPKGHDTGYTQSKWVAEGLCEIARERGVPVAIFRPGNILGASDTGNVNPEDYLTRVIRACVQLGAAPIREYHLPVGTVDDVAKTIVAVSQTPIVAEHTFHVFQPEPLPWNRLFEGLRSAGYEVPSVPWAQWCALLKKELAAGRENALSALADMLNAPADRFMPRFDVERVRHLRTTLGLSYPLLDAAYFDRMLRHLADAPLLR